MKTLLENRLTNVTKELGSRPGGEEKIGGKFPGIFSYYVGVRYYSYCPLINISFQHNPNYKKYLQTKGLQESESPMSK